MAIIRVTKIAIIAACLVAMIGATSRVAAAESGSAGKKTSDILGAPGYMPTPEHPLGWRGDWTGHFPGATPPTTWSRRAMGITSELRYQADKPSGEPAKDSQQLEYFTIKDWLVAGPFPAADPAKDIDKDFLGGEATVQPARDAKAGDLTWKYLRADMATQSRHECNEGTCTQSWIDFVYAFGKIAPSWGTEKVDLEGDFVNKAAYAHTYIFAPTAGTVQLQMLFAGTAGRFWLNGQPTNLDPGNRGKTIDIALAKGWNRLLIKVTTSNGLGTSWTKNWHSIWMVATYLMPKAPVSYETKNITWMTKMTGRSMSQPIIVGDKIFVGSGMSDLLCLDKKSGKVLWLRSNTPYDALTPVERAALTGMQDKIEPLVAQLNAHNDELVAAINAAVSPQGLSSDQQAAVDQKVAAKTAAERAVHDAFAAIDKKKYPQLYLNEVASGNATPVSDGTYVYWVCGGGQHVVFSFVFSCFDLEGKRMWSRLDATLNAGEHGSHASPCLVEGKLIYGCNKTLIAFDAKTGKELWRNPSEGGFGASATGPIVGKLGGISVIINRSQIHRVADGTVVCPSSIDVFFSDQTAVADKDVYYTFGVFKGHGIPASFTAVKLPSGAGSKPEILWAPDGKDVAPPLRGAEYSVASPLYVDGLVYWADMSGGFVILDPAAKKCLYRQWLDGYNRFHRFLYGMVASPTLGGKSIYITDDAGYTHLLQPGPQFKEVARNVIENIFPSGGGGIGPNPCHQELFYTSPYFDGKAMYLRGEEYLYCIIGRE